MNDEDRKDAFGRLGLLGVVGPGQVANRKLHIYPCFIRVNPWLNALFWPGPSHEHLGAPQGH